MRKALFVHIAAMFVFLSMAAYAQAGLTVREAAIARGIEDHEPVGVAGTFPPDVGKVYCYTKIAGGRPGDHITHVWYYGERKMAEVELAIGSPLFRTYSSKRILPSWTGGWRVEVLGPDGTVLQTLEFTIEKKKED